MTCIEAIETIKNNWPPDNYSMLREALTKAIEVLENESARLTRNHARETPDNCTCGMGRD
jgi:ABC-type transporter lipoprotein component MlaA